MVRHRKPWNPPVRIRFTRRMCGGTEAGRLANAEGWPRVDLDLRAVRLLAHREGAGVGGHERGRAGLGWAVANGAADPTTRATGSARSWVPSMTSRNTRGPCCIARWPRASTVPLAAPVAANGRLGGLPSPVEYGSDRMPKAHMTGKVLLGEAGIRVGWRGTRGTSSCLLATGARCCGSRSTNLTMGVVRGAGRTAVLNRSCALAHAREFEIGPRRPATGSGAAGSLVELGQHRERNHVGSPSLLGAYEHTERSRQLMLVCLATHDPSGLQPVVQTSVRHLRHTVSPHQEP